MLGVALAGTGDLGAQSRSGGHTSGSHTTNGASTAKPGLTVVTQPSSPTASKGTTKTVGKTMNKTAPKTATKRKKKMAGGTDLSPGLIIGTVTAVLRSKQDTAKGTIVVRPGQQELSKGKSTRTVSQGNPDMRMQVSQATQYMSHQHRSPSFKDVRQGDQVRITADDGKHALQVEIMSSQNSTTSSKSSSTRSTSTRK
jgi:hypothetical protein